MTVTVTDNEDPTVTTSGNVTANTSDGGTGDCTVSLAITNATFGDNCPASVLTWAMTGATVATGNGQVGTYTFNSGVTTITYTVTDGALRTATDFMTVSVADNEKPTLSCIANQVRGTNTGCTYVVSGSEFNLSASSDNCAITNTTYELTGATVTGPVSGTSLAGVVFNPGVTNVIWVVYDAAGNSETCSFTVSVADDDDPVITCPVAGQQNVTTNTACTYVYSGTGWNATAIDNCTASPTITYTLTGATTGTGTSLNNVAFNLGVTTVTWEAEDAVGNDITCSFSVSVTDDDDPVISCPVTGQQNVTTSAGCTYVHSGTGWNATATDNCTATPTLTYTLTGATTGTGTTLNNVVFNLGTTTVTWEAEDAAGNDVTCVYSVLVADDDDPVISCPVSGQQNVTTNSGCTYVLSGTGWNATATDNCTASPSLTYTLTGATTGTGSSLNAVAFNTGITTVTWKAEDAAGNDITALHCFGYRRRQSCNHLSCQRPAGCDYKYRLYIHLQRNRLECHCH